MKIKAICIVVFSLAFSVLSGAFLTRQRQNKICALANVEETKFGTVTISDGGISGAASITVVDASSKPIAGCIVLLDNSSGGTQGVTDINGNTIIYPGESEIEGVFVDGISVLRRPYARYYQFPSVSKGVVFKIKLTRETLQ